MPLNRSKLSINRTLLILLGIILACLLTLNARSFYSSEAISLPHNAPTEKVDKNASAKFVEKIGVSAIRHLIEKATSLEK